MHNLYTPTNRTELREICEMLADDKNSPIQLMIKHANFGHHFDGNVAITAQQAYILKGKPSLSADAMHAIARKSGLVQFIRVKSLDHQHCTYEMSRKDEPDNVVHIWTYSFEMAEHQGLTRNRNWQQMPMQMLRARALTLGLRGTFPEAVSGIYSADEIADNQPMNDDERAELTAEVFGEKLEKVEKKTKVNASTGEIVDPNGYPESYHQKAIEERKSKQQLKRNLGYSFNSVDDFWAAVKNKGIDEKQAKHAILVQKIDLESLNPKGLSEAFYLVCCTPAFRTSTWQYPPKDAGDHNILVSNLRHYVGLSFYRDMLEDYSSLTNCLSDAAWHESLMLLKGKSGDYKTNLMRPVIDKANTILKQMTLGDWSAYDMIENLVKDPMSYADDSNAQDESIPF